MVKGKWYIMDEIHPGIFIPDLSRDQRANVEVIDLDDDVIEIIEKLFTEPFRNDSTRCISFYRDTIVLDEKIYNICLSCGDINVDGEDKLISSEQEIGLKKLKQKLRGKTTARDFINEDPNRLPNHEQLMIKFAKFHLEEFKEIISKKGFQYTHHDGWDWTVDSEALNNLYPTENIK